MKGECDALLLRHSENPNRESAHRARYAIAVEIEHGEFGSSNIGGCIHLHAVDDGQEIFAQQPECTDGRTERLGTAREPPLKQGVDVASPRFQLFQTVAGSAPAIRYVVHSATETIDFEHSLALHRRQDAH